MIRGWWSWCRVLRDELTLAELRRTAVPLARRYATR